MIPVSKPVVRPVRRVPVEDAPPSQPSPSSPAAAEQASPPRPSRPQRLGATTQAIASPGSKKTIWQSWLALRPSVRMAMGISVAAFAVLGMVTADKLQASYPAENTDNPSQTQGSSADDTGADGRPRKFGIRVLDRVPPATTA
ncbi:unnamed protein product [Tilletia laevis]|uniref:Uncharacterized protein n=1 Tax=Tilletia laevis TaxID=157183 RepID=A0A9N8M0W9_9BASI|nr:hypothetical protein CF336_g3171 [Tilletia laevis]CAD6919671.1 unnamed protein product [Tilletia laevis]CAD6945683.1 unnamed protein product [Tilletia laevis]CAD7060957.1 unnamed protein product [Tilletia caries]